MSLLARLSIFFLATLAVVLVGFSAALYVLAQVYLNQQVNDRLTAVLDVLDSGVDREVDGLDWEPNERHVPLGKDQGPQAILWEVRDVDDTVVARSENLGKDVIGFKSSSLAQEVNHGVQTYEREGHAWLFGWRRVHFPGVASARSPLGMKRYQTIMLYGSFSLEPMQATLRGLTLALIGLSSGIWLAAAFACRHLCRRALAPLTRMATAARQMDAADLDERLPGPTSPDELGDLHAAFNGLLGRLQEAFERQRHFTGDASHQLRTPLTAMLGQVEVALRRERPAEEYRRVLALVQDQAGHMRRIVEALLFLARADAEADLAPLESVAISTWLPVHLREWADHPRAADLQVECQTEARVRIQPLLLGQLLDNLVDNAFKYSAPATAVTIGAATQNGTFTLTVQDAGQGIGPDDLPHVFEPFYRSAEARRRGQIGVGLGLATAQRIAGAFGGSLAVESVAGQGSRFTLRLPVPPPASP
jgi:heavy metal sensor kinase